MGYQAPRGTFDLLPGEGHRWSALEQAWFAFTLRFGYREVRTPMFEDIDVFLRSAGETSDIVSKEMYEFVDKGGRRVALKPEGTAPVMRMLIERGKLPQGAPVRCSYATPIFRYGRPGKGRFRQAHQLGLELVGSGSATADAEVVEIAYRFFESLGIQGISIRLNSIGRAECRRQFEAVVLEHMAGYLADATEEIRAKSQKNPLGMLDTKDPEMQAALKGLPPILDYLEPESRDRFEQLQGLLGEAGVPYAVDAGIVRGLDYYTETVFEVTTPKLEGLSLCGGGRYDHLVEQLDGPATPAVGLGIGIERLFLALEEENPLSVEPSLDVFVVTMGEETSPSARKLAQELRAGGFSAAFDLETKKAGHQLKQATRLGARFAAILGEDEVAAGTVTLRNLSTGEQTSVPRGGVEEWLRGHGA